MDKILTQAVWKMRMQDDFKAGREVNAQLINTKGATYQLYVPSKGCKYACTMCNYGFNHPIRKEEILKDVDEICNNLPEDMNTIILESSGSFLDTYELPTDLQDKIIRRVARTNVNLIQIETHYETLTEERVKKIKQLVFPKEFSFELGLESTQVDIVKVYNKHMDITQLLETIWMCENNGSSVSLNLMVGAPLLTIEEQIQNVVASIHWIIENCPKSTAIVLFPLNIKDYTLVKHMYNQGRYEIIYDWEFIEVLKQIPEKELHRTFISWWGNRCNEFHGEKAIIKPFHCDECHEQLNLFYNHFVESGTDGKRKARLIREISEIKMQMQDRI